MDELSFNEKLCLVTAMRRYRDFLEREMNLCKPDGDAHQSFSSEWAEAKETYAKVLKLTIQ